MFKPKFLAVALSAAVPIAGMTLVGCESRQRQEQPESERQVQPREEQQEEPFGQMEPRREQDQPMQGQEIEPQRGQEQGQAQPQEGQDVRSIEPVRGQELGQRTVSEGEQTVEARRRVLETNIVEYDIPTVRVCEEKADLNQMQAEHFSALGVSPDVAQRIIDYREQQGGQLRSVDDLNNVQGIDRSTLQNLEQQVAVQPQGQQQR